MPTKMDDRFNLSYTIVTADGHEVSLEPVAIAEETDEHVKWLADMPMEFTINAFIRNARGLLDYLCGRIWTKPCWRFIRSARRHKEKERRKRLKEAMHGV